MKTKDIIKNLRVDSKYYGEYGKQWLSNSDVYTLLYDREQYGCKTTVTDSMLKGSYLHTLIFQPHKKKDYIIWDKTDTRGKAYKEYLVENNLDIILTRKEADEVEEQAEWLMDKNNPKTLNNKIGNTPIVDFLHDKKAKREEPIVGEIFGVDFKGKADLISNDIILDLKRTNDVKRFPNKVKYESSYDTQAFIYQTLFGLPFVFLVIGDKKKTRADGTIYYDMGVHAATDEVLIRGKRNTQEAVMRYIEEQEGTSNLESFIYNTILT